MLKNPVAYILDGTISDVVRILMAFSIHQRCQKKFHFSQEVLRTDLLETVYEGLLNSFPYVVNNQSNF
jgi:hypothetical protein